MDAASIVCRNFDRLHYVRPGALLPPPLGSVERLLERLEDLPHAAPLQGWQVGLRSFPEVLGPSFRH